MSRILRFSFLMLLLAAFHLGAYAQEQTEAKTAKVKLTKSEKKELNDSIRARARQRALEKEVDRQYRKLERQKMKEIPVSEEDVVYLFGVGTNFNDSTVYLTDIIPVHNLQIQKKTHFLPHRTEFSLQLREYLEGQLGLAHETTAIFFADKRKKIAKNYYKLKKRYLDEGYSSLIVIDPVMSSRFLNFSRVKSVS